MVKEGSITRPAFQNPDMEMEMNRRKGNLCPYILVIFLVGNLSFGQLKTTVGERISGNESESIDNSKTYTNPLGMEFRLIPEGPHKYTVNAEKRKVRKATFSEPIFMATTELTQEHYKEVVGKNPSHIIGDDYPVTRVSWDDAKEFCRKLSRLDIKMDYRLPSPAEWEAACRAGSPKDYCFGHITDQAGYKILRTYTWYDRNSGFPREIKDYLVSGDDDLDAELLFFDGEMRGHLPGLHPVAQLKANDWGYYDMHGNVAEWCNQTDSTRDISIAYAGTQGTDARQFRQWIVKGGSFASASGNCTSWAIWKASSSGKIMVGFRVVAVPAGTEIEWAGKYPEVIPVEPRDYNPPWGKSSMPSALNDWSEFDNPPWQRNSDPVDPFDLPDTVAPWENRGKVNDDLGVYR